MSLSFLDLPAEVHREIWEFVPFQGWITLSLVNRQIQHLTRVEPSWPEVVLLFDGEPCPLNWLQRHGKALRKVHARLASCNSVPQSILSYVGTQLRQLQLEFSYMAGSAPVSLAVFPHLQRLVWVRKQGQPTPHCGLCIEDLPQSLQDVSILTDMQAGELGALPRLHRLNKLSVRFRASEDHICEPLQALSQLAGLRELQELTQLTRLVFRYDWGMPPHSLPTRPDLSLGLVMAMPVGNLWNVPQFTNLTSLQVLNADGDTYLGHLASLHLGPLMACRFLTSLTLELYCRVQGLAPLVPRLTRLVMTGIGELRVRDSDTDHAAVWLANQTVQPTTQPTADLHAGPDRLYTIPRPQPCSSALSPPSPSSSSPPPPLASVACSSSQGGAGGSDRGHCEEVRQIQQQWCGKGLRTGSQGLPDEETCGKRLQLLSELERSQPLPLREVCLVYKTLDVGFVAQLAAAMPVRMRAAEFAEVSKTESVLAGVIDGEEVPRGCYHALFTSPELVGEGGARLLKGCREVRAGACLSKLRMLATYGL